MIQKTGSIHVYFQRNKGHLAGVIDLHPACMVCPLRLSEQQGGCQCRTGCSLAGGIQSPVISEDPGGE